MDIRKKIFSSAMDLNCGECKIAPWPTGLGKSYYSVDLIVDNLVARRLGKPYRLIVYSISQKNEKPSQKILKRLEERGYPEEKFHLFEDYVLDVKSKEDIFLEFFSNKSNMETLYKEIIKLDSKLIKEKKIKDKFDDFINCFNYYMDQKNSIISEEKRERSRERFSEAESIFRKQLLDGLGIPKDLKDSTEKEKYLANNFKWILDLYPVIKASEKSVFLMTHSMLTKRKLNLFGISQEWVSADLLDNAIYLIDESDAFFDACFNECNSQADMDIDLLVLFNSIYHGISTVIKSRENHLEEVSTNCIPLNKLKDWINKADEILKIVDLKNHLIRTNDDENGFIFKTGDTLTFSVIFGTDLNNNDFERNYYIVEKQLPPFTPSGTASYLLTTNQNHKNLLYREKSNGKTVKLTLNNIIYKIKNLIDEFVKISHNFIQDSIKNRIIAESGLYENIRNLLEEFRFNQSSKEKDYLAKRILSYQEFKNLNSYNIFKHKSIFNSGFSFFIVHKEPGVKARNKISMIRLNRTPESFLFNIASHASLVLLSGTALADTPAHNFDLNTLEEKITIKYPTSKEINELQKLYNQLNKNKVEYSIINEKLQDEGINFNDPNFFINFSNSSDCLDKLTKDPNKRTTLLSFLKDNENSFKNKGLILPKLEFLFYLNYFIENPKAIYSLMILHKNIKQSTINSIVKALDAYSNDIDVSVVNAKNVTRKIPQIQSKLQNGRRQIIISTEACLGKSVNLQTKITPNLNKLIVDNGLKLIDLNNEEYNKDFLDINGLYIEAPRHILPVIKKDENLLIENKNLISIFHTICRMYESGDVSEIVYIAMNRNTFKSYCNSKVINVSPYGKNLNKEVICKTDSYKNKIGRSLTQITGRMVRSFKKPDSNFLGFESCLFQEKSTTIFPDCFEDILLTEPMKVIREYVLDNYPIVPSDYSKDLNKGNIQNKRLKTFTDKISKSIMTGKMTEEDIYNHNTLQYLHAKFPTITNEEFKQLSPNEQEMINDFYMHSPKLVDSYLIQFNQNYKGKDYLAFVTIEEFINSHTDQINKNDMNYLIEEPKDLLKDILRDEEIHKEFSKEYPDKWKPGDFILCPHAFNTFYVGEVCEIVGKIMLEKLGYKLLTVNNESYEIFDSIIESKDAYILIDFKGYRTEISGDTEEKFLNKYKRKVEKFKNRTLWIGDHCFDPQKELKVLVINLPITKESKNGYRALPHLYSESKLLFFPEFANCYELIKNNLQESLDEPSFKEFIGINL